MTCAPELLNGSEPAALDGGVMSSEGGALSGIAAIASIYEAGAEADRVALSLIVDALGGALAFKADVFLSDTGPANFVEVAGRDDYPARFEDLRAPYLDGAHHFDLTPLGIGSQIAGGASRGLVRSNDLPWPADREYPRWNRARLGTESWITDWRLVGHDRLEAVVLHHAPGTTPPGPGEIETFRALSHHLAAARRIALRAERAADDRDPCPVLVVDGRMRLRHANPAGEAFLGRAVLFALANGRICPHEPGAARRFEALVRAAAAPGGSARPASAMAAPGRAGTMHLVSVTTTRAEAEATGSGCLAARVRIVDGAPAPSDAAMEAWREIFGLTAAEARLAAVLLSKDRTLREVAGDHGVSYNTARTHVAHLFAKTGTTSQAALLRLLTRTESLFGRT